MTEEPLLSLVIPTLNEAAILPASLLRLQRWRDVAELIVVDGGSEDDSVSLARELCDRVILSEPGRARQMNAGAAAARGRYLLFLHCDTSLGVDPTAMAAVLQPEPRWGFFRVRLSGVDWRLRLVETGMNLRSRLTRVATGDQCLFVHRDCWWRLGGYADLPLMEDVEICKRLRREAAPVIVREPVISSSRRWEEFGVVTTVVQMWYLRLAFWLGASPGYLARRYYG